MCAKYQGSNIKTVTWAQKVNFRQKNTKKVKEKNTFSPLTQKTVEHFSFFFRKLTDLRGCFLPKLPHTSNCLYSSFEQLIRTCTYYRIALSRRANSPNAAR